MSDSTTPPRVTLSIGNLKFKALFDSGAGKSLINSDLYRRLENGIERFSSEVSVELFDINNRRLTTRGTISLRFHLVGETDGEPMVQEFIVVDNITEDCVLGLDALYGHKFMFDGRERTIYRLKEPNQLSPHEPVMIVAKKIKIPPFSASVIESERGGGKLPLDVGCYFTKAPELPNGLRLDPFVSQMQEDGLFRIVAVNETNKPITLPEMQVLGRVSLTPQVAKTSISACTIGNTTVDPAVLEAALPDLPNEQKEALRSLLTENASLFAFATKDLGSTGLVKHTIDTQGLGPIRLRPYRSSPKQKEVANKIIEELLENNIIQPSLSPWAAPIVLVKKKSGEDRLCIDYRKLNSITKKASFPLPRIDDVLDTLQGQKIFSTLDLASGYWQIEMDDKSKEKTAFIVDNNIYEWNRLAFGLTNAPGTFQRLMNHVLRKEIGISCLVYLDDIIVFSRTLEEHLDNLRRIFGLLEQANLKLKLSKCKFLETSVSYLGHIISASGIAPDPSKIASIANFKRPETVVELQSFLGLANYYRRFISSFSTKAHSLTLQAKGKPKDKINWGPEEEKAFDTLRKSLITPPILAFPDFSKEFILFTDASNFGIGAVLSQIQNDEEVVIAYYSKHLNEREVKFSTIEKEAFAVVEAIKRFRQYLQDEPFVIISDHRPLQWLQSLKDETGRLGRWAIRLANVKYTIRYRPGRVHENADCLSRIPIASVTAVSPSMDETTAETSDTKIIYEEQQKDRLCKEILAYWESGLLWDDDNRNPPTWAREIDLFFLSNGILCRNSTPYSKKRRQFSQQQIVMPLSLRKRLMEDYHDAPISGHLAFRRTLYRVRDKFYWPSMVDDIKEYCKACTECAMQRRVKNKTFLNSFDLTSAPNEVIGMDFLGPIRPSSIGGNNYVLVMTDYFTKWVEVAALPDTTALTTCKSLMEKIVLRHGPPKIIVTDRGSNFTAELFRELSKALGVKHRTTTAYHPQSNGHTERFNQTVVDMIRKYTDDSFANWEEMLHLVAFAYRNSIHSSTLETPYFLTHGRDPTMPLDRFLIPPKELPLAPKAYKSNLFLKLYEAFQLAKDNLRHARDAQKEQYDKRAKEAIYFPGDKVLLDVRKRIQGTSKKLNPRYKGPYNVVKMNENGTVLIIASTGKQTQLVHVNRIKPLYESMIWKDEPCVDFYDLRTDALHSETAQAEHTQISLAPRVTKKTKKLGKNRQTAPLQSTPPPPPPPLPRPGQRPGTRAWTIHNQLAAPNN